MRTIDLSTMLRPGISGFTSSSICKKDYITASITSWTHFYHKPYANDWDEAREKAKEKVKHLSMVKLYS